MKEELFAQREIIIAFNFIILVKESGADLAEIVSDAKTGGGGGGCLMA